MSDTTAKRKKIRLRRGDLFEITVMDGRLGYGVVIEPGTSLYLAFKKRLYLERPTVDGLIRDEIVLVGSTSDALFFHGRWVVIAHDFPIPAGIPFPNWKLGTGDDLRTTDFQGRMSWPPRPDEVNLLDYKFSMSPTIYQDALEALNGMGEWQKHHEKLLVDYAKRRVTRSAS